MDKKIQPLSVSSHSNFFSSLKQVEKRLKLEQTSLPIESQIQESTLGSPMFLQPSGSQNSASQDSSEPPQAFLSVSQEFPEPNQGPSQTDPENEAEDDDIGVLMQLLGLTEEQEERGGFDDGGSCHCEGGFYEKIVGVEGPKCGKEVQRLDGWIKHFLSGGREKQEPLRLAHLLLGKAAFISDGAFGGLDFPSTIQEFLHTDPPSN
ncbi:uncharacterized protein LOC109813214 [Cajanus cajan]|uniref:Uncharacterized protein n=1 Tax=Cajanus cajan TaxID=3821 RepID=A0A151S484_CAJCA|nr:uncharacterized protein LOC109813214 [Cajanus cajan]KYP49645.1 hypothetical protein KK1_028616 [Cajanus cajan]